MPSGSCGRRSRRWPQAIRNDFEAARARERALVAALERQKVEVQALNGKAVEYTALEREATATVRLLDKLLQRSREASLARELQSANVANRGFG